ncbi:WD repeat-containing protein [Fusarium heterosporum]|uniref:WD repeat-containing protein n=1 Tax=Fusarium heterosporum TaxID=42747 RepID=A0A8H5TXE0_FUSHE|nr:WD repeat-containing protein [Fusarium heterosporum]
MDDAKLISSKVSLILDLPPSCVQFCPTHPDLCVVGTYNLEKNEEDVQANHQDPDNDEAATATKTPQSRNGSLLVYRILQPPSPDSFSTISYLRPPVPSWKRSGRCSGGDIEYRDIGCFQTGPYKQRIISTAPHLDKQCNWHPEMPYMIGVTTSTSSALLLRLDDAYSITEYADLNIANSLEAWCIAFSFGTVKPDQDKVQITAYCGGDDSMLRYTSCISDLRESDPLCEEPYSPITIKGQHNAGVTAILPLPLLIKNNGRVVVTGSYDDHLRVLIIHDLHETYGMKKVELVLEENMGGGVWRLDLVKIREGAESTKIRILASCMHAGARIVDLEVRRA